jgi:hypothetical protein
MWKLLLLPALLPLLAAMLAWQVWWARVARRQVGAVKGAPTARELAAGLLAAAGRQAQVVKGLLPDGRGLRVVLPGKRWEGRDAASLGAAVQAVGLCLLAAKEPEVVAARVRVLRFGAVVPALALLVALFAVLAARASVGWAFTGVLLIAGLATLGLWLTVAAELRAAAAGLIALRSARLAISAGDREQIEKCTRAAAWRRSLPLCLEWITGSDQP